MCSYHNLSKMLTLGRSLRIQRLEISVEVFTFAVITVILRKFHEGWYVLLERGISWIWSSILYMYRPIPSCIIKIACCYPSILPTYPILFSFARNLPSSVGLQWNHLSFPGAQDCKGQGHHCLMDPTKCIPYKKFCNGVADCADSSDEGNHCEGKVVLTHWFQSSAFLILYMGVCGYSGWHWAVKDICGVTGAPIHWRTPRKSG